MEETVGGLDMHVACSGHVSYTAQHKFAQQVVSFDSIRNVWPQDPAYKYMQGDRNKPETHLKNAQTFKLQRARMFCHLSRSCPGHCL
jgi:hypothetical protein